MPCTTVIQT